MIELIMVIVILGILAAVAIPRFVDLSTQAEDSACDGVKGAIASAASIYYAQMAANGSTPVFPTDLTVLGTQAMADGLTPVCPGGGTLTYSNATGTATCNLHG